MDDYIGTIRESKKYGKYKVEELVKIDKQKSYKKYYRIKFLDTGFEYIADRDTIRQNQVKDYYKPNVYGVGYIGDNYKNIDKKIMSLWRGMLGRCYNKTNASYKNYGAKGIKVCDRWLCYTNFANDIIKLDGYDEELFKQGKLVLDKDLKQRNIPLEKRIYSPDTCVFITKKQNNILAYGDNLTKFTALSPDGKFYKGENVKEFAEKHGLEAVAIYSIIKGKKHHYTIKGWAFGDENCTIEDLKKKQNRHINDRLVTFFAVDPLGNIHKAKGVKYFALANDMNRGNIWLCLQGKRKSHKGWRFFYTEDEAKQYVEGMN
jgi:hypothetical protein